MSKESDLMKQSYCYPNGCKNKKCKRHWSHISKGSKYAYFGNYDGVCYDYISKLVKEINKGE